MTTSSSGGSRLFGSLPRIGTWKVFQGPSDGRKFSQMWGCSRVLQQWGLKMNKSAWQSSFRMVRNVRSHFAASCWDLSPLHVRQQLLRKMEEMKRYQWPFDSIQLCRLFAWTKYSYSYYHDIQDSRQFKFQSQWHYLQYSSVTCQMIIMSMTNY